MVRQVFSPPMLSGVISVYPLSLLKAKKMSKFGNVPTVHTT